MSKILIKEALIIPLNDQKPKCFYGDILVENDRIAAISERPDVINADQADHVINACNLIVMPGLINTHGHAAMTLFRSYADDMPLKDWLEQKIWPIEEHLTDDDIYWGTMLALAEMIRGGTTTFTDMYFHMERVAEAAAESGIRAVLSRGLIGSGDNSEEVLTETKAFIDNWHGAENGRINIMWGPHAPYTCPPDFLQKVIKLAGQTDRPIQIHVSETKHEVEESIRINGKTPPKHLFDLGLFDMPVIAAHCVHVNDDDIALLAEKKVGVAHNPGSNLKLGSGIAPVSKMLARGISVGIGTDGAASNNNLDMIEEMRLAALLAKGVSMDPTLINAKTALEMATILGAAALKIEETGMLKEGYKADLIGLRYDRPHMLPLNDPLAHLVYAAAAADVDFNIVDGRILLECGKLTTLDEEKVKAEASRCATRLVNKGKGIE